MAQPGTLTPPYPDYSDLPPPYGPDMANPVTAQPIGTAETINLEREVNLQDEDAPKQIESCCCAHGNEVYCGYEILNLICSLFRGLCHCCVAPNNDRCCNCERGDAGGDGGCCDGGCCDGGCCDGGCCDGGCDGGCYDAGCDMGDCVGCVVEFALPLLVRDAMAAFKNKNKKPVD